MKVANGYIPRIFLLFENSNNLTRKVVISSPNAWKAYSQPYLRNVKSKLEILKQQIKKCDKILAVFQKSCSNTCNLLDLCLFSIWYILQMALPEGFQMKNNPHWEEITIPATQRVAKNCWPLVDINELDEVCVSFQDKLWKSVGGVHFNISLLCGFLKYQALQS